MSLLLLLGVGYFIVQGLFFWWLIDRPLGRWKMAAMILGALLFLPGIMYVDGLSKQFGDGGAANTVMIFLAVVGGVLTLVAAFFIRAIAQQSSLK
jgi:hypothetical protein